jgi:hypothetical protein
VLAQNVISLSTFLIAELGDARGQEAFDLGKTKFKGDANAMIALQQFETQLSQATTKK